jgi:ABC-type Na+ efflux pump permease subunit
MVKLSWREKYAGILVLLIGIIFLLMQLGSLFSNTSRPYGIQNGTFVIDKNEALSDLKTYSVIIAGLVAGWCLLTGKRLGWMLGVPILLFITAVIGAITVEQVLKAKKIDNSMIGFGVGIFLLFLAILFLLLPSARQKYRVSKGVLILTLLLFVGLGGAYLFLQ